VPSRSRDVASWRNCDTPSMALSLPEPDSRAACGVARHPEGDPRAHCGAIFCRGKVQETGGRHPMRRRRVTGISSEGIARVSHEKPPADFAVNLRRLNLLPPLERARGGKDHRGLRARQERLADGEAQAGARVDHADSRPLPHRSAAFDWRPGSRKSSLTRTAFSTPRRTILHAGRSVGTDSPLRRKGARTVEET
jgi:hypothetical protein